METVDQVKTKARIKNIRKRLHQHQQYSAFWELLDMEFALKKRKEKRL